MGERLASVARAEALSNSGSLPRSSERARDRAGRANSVRMPAPAVDGLDQEIQALVIGFPGLGEVRAAAVGPQRALEVVEPDAHGMRHTFADRNRFLLAERRQRPEEARRRLWQGASDEVLVLVVGHAHGEDGAALGKDCLRDLRGSLRDQAERDAVFAPFFRNPRDRPPRRFEAKAVVVGNVAMRLVQTRRIGTDFSRWLQIAKSKIKRHSSDTTTFTISDGTLERSRMVMGLPLTGMRRRRERISVRLSRTVRPGNMKA